MPSGSGSMPRTIWVMVALPASATSYTSGRLDLALRAHRRGQFGQCLLRQLLQLVQRAGVHHGGADPGDHVRAERLLLVQRGGHRDRGAGAQVEQGGHHGGGAQVEGDAEPAVGGVARLDGDQHVVHDHRGDVIVGRAQGPAEGPQHREFGPGLEVVELGQYPLQVAGLVGQVRLGHFQVPLLHRRAQDDLPPDADRGRLGPGGQRRHLDGGVTGRQGPAGQPPAVLEFGGGVRPDVQAGRRRRVVGDPDPALLAGAVAAAGRVDRDAVPAGGVEQRHAVRNPDGPLIEKQIYPNGPGCLLLVNRHVRSLDSAPRPFPWPAGRDGRRSSSRPTRPGSAPGRRP